MTEPVRLAKRVAEQFSCSRREAEIFIEGGYVTVDGRVIEEPQFRVSDEVIVLLPDATLTAAEPVTIVLHQPVADGVHVPVDINAENHAVDDASGIRSLKRHFSRLTTALPLDPQAGGLAVLTQDWRVTRKLVDNASTVEQEYVVEVASELGSTDLKQLERRSAMNGRDLPPAKVSMQSETRLRFAVKGPQPGQIAYLCANAGLNVISIKRIRIGRIAMARLLPGQWRYLPAQERF